MVSVPADDHENEHAAAVQCRRRYRRSHPDTVAERPACCGPRRSYGIRLFFLVILAASHTMLPL